MAEMAASMAVATQSAQNRVPNIEGATTGATFPKLPFELRSRIWRYSFPPPRSIRLAADDKSEFPVTLWINYESRTETLKYYVLFNNEIPRTLACHVYDVSHRLVIWHPSMLDTSVAIWWWTSNQGLSFSTEM